MTVALEPIKGSLISHLVGPHTFPDTVVQRRIEQLILRLLIATIHSLKRGDPSDFDALVGDQACQIRSLQLALMFREGQFLSQLDEIFYHTQSALEKVDASLEEVARIEAQHKCRIKDLGKLVRAGKREGMTREWRSQQCDEEVSSLTQRMRNCLSSHPVEMPDIPDELLSLLRLYSLTKSKERRLKQAGDELLFRELTNVSRLPGSGRFLKRYFTRSLLQMKELVTRESAAFLQEQAQCLQPPLVLSPLREVSVEGPYPGIIRYQHEFPCLFQFHVIFRRALEAGIGVLLKIRSSEDSPLDPNSYLLRQEFRAIDGEYTMVEEKSTSQVCIAVEARARQPRQCLNRDLLRRTLQRGGGLLGVLWMGAAQHTQFSDGKDDGLSDVQKNEIQVLASKAQQLGFSRCNPSLCCLEHIYCAAPNQETGSG